MHDGLFMINSSHIPVEVIQRPVSCGSICFCFSGGIIQVNFLCPSSFTPTCSFSQRLIPFKLTACSRTARWSKERAALTAYQYWITWKQGHWFRMIRMPCSVGLRPRPRRHTRYPLSVSAVNDFPRVFSCGVFTGEGVYRGGWGVSVTVATPPIKTIYVWDKDLRTCFTFKHNNTETRRLTGRLEHLGE